ncbi:protein serrate [Trichonephila clavipes]|nr:protein serrate [Trichonephila clavipes]
MEWKIKGHRGRAARISYRYRVLCSPHYYDYTCAKFCRPRDDRFGHYKCDEQGDKVCLEGWQGPNCETGKWGECGEEDQISSCIAHIKNLISLTSSQYNELNGYATLSEWTKTAPLKKVFSAQPIGTRRKGRQNFIWIDGLEKDLLVLRIKNRRTLAEEGWPGKGFLRRPRPILGCRELKKEGIRIRRNSILFSNNN